MIRFVLYALVRIGLLVYQRRKQAVLDAGNEVLPLSHRAHAEKDPVEKMRLLNERHLSVPTEWKSYELTMRVAMRKVELINDTAEQIHLCDMVTNAFMKCPKWVYFPLRPIHRGPLEQR